MTSDSLRSTLLEGEKLHTSQLNIWTESWEERKIVILSATDSDFDHQTIGTTQGKAFQYRVIGQRVDRWDSLFNQPRLVGWVFTTNVFLIHLTPIGKRDNNHKRSRDKGLPIILYARQHFQRCTPFLLVAITMATNFLCTLQPTSTDTLPVP